MSDEKDLNEKELALIRLLVQGKSHQDAATLLGISEYTVKRWLQRPHVQALYQQLRHNATEHIKKEIEALSSKAVIAIEDLLGGKSPLAKFNAAKLVIDRVAPEIKGAIEQQPEQNEVIPRDLIQYATAEEIDHVNSLVETWQARRDQAEQDRVRLQA